MDHQNTKNTDLEIKFKKACIEGDLNMVKYCLGRDVNIYVDNDFAIVEASLNGHLDVLKYLVENGSSLYGTYSRVMKAACKGGHLHIVEYLEKFETYHIQDKDFLYAGIEHGHLDIVKHFSQEDPDSYSLLNKQDMIDMAKKRGHRRIVKHLVQWFKKKE